MNPEGKSSNLFLFDVRGILCESQREELHVFGILSTMSLIVRLGYICQFFPVNLGSEG